MKKKKLILRELKPEEIPDIFPLVHLHNPRVTRTKFNAALGDMIPLGYHVVAAFDGTKMVGISGFWLRTRFWSGRQLDIDNFFVHPDYRGSGLGKRITQWLEKHALKEKCELIVLDAYADSFLAHRFYHREGFVSTGYHMTKVPGTNVPFGRC
jgi:GNAT superfamily N-acetyltransferase